ncbi:hypothetical protein, partial [Geobacillus subterraneus]|uniref:hypothetical protein n=1 Tax=Geobacillus subterraneus TaxID=129338 RepID=UPI001C129FBD
SNRKLIGFVSFGTDTKRVKRPQLFVLSSFGRHQLATLRACCGGDSLLAGPPARFADRRAASAFRLRFVSFSFQGARSIVPSCAEELGFVKFTRTRKLCFTPSFALLSQETV